MRTHRTAIPLILVFLAATASAALADPATPPAHPDLTLVVGLSTPKRIKVGEPIQLTAKLVNRGKRKHRVVLPGDGSESAWREPHTYFSATRKTADGEWEAVATKPIMRCGLYDHDWSDEIVSLKPKQRLDIGAWLGQPQYSLDLSKAGTYRITLHYVYTAGAASKGRAATKVPKSMLGVAPFAVKSASSVTVTVRAPVEKTPETGR